MTVRNILVIGGSALVSVQILKLVSILLAIRWIVFHGQDFARLLKAHEDRFSEQVYWQLLDQTNAKRVLPLGVLEYRLLRFAARTPPPVGKALRLLRLVVYDFTSIGVISMTFLYLASAPMFAQHARGVVPSLAAASAALVVAQLIAFYAEACVSYARLGSYGLAFHKASRYVETRTTSGAYFTEVKILAGAVLYSLGTGAFILYFTAWHGGRFASLAVSGATFEGTVRDLLNCAYFSLTTFFTADTAGPVTGSARAAAAALVAQAVCALILAVSTFTLYIPALLEQHSAQEVDRILQPAAVRDPAKSVARDGIELLGDPPVAPNRHPSVRKASWILGGAVIGAVVVSVIRPRTARKHDGRGKGGV